MDTEQSGPFESVGEADVLLHSIISVIKIKVRNEEWKDIKFILRSENFLKLLSYPTLSCVSLEPAYMLKNLLKFLLVSEIRKTALWVIAYFTEELIENDSFPPTCVEEIATFLVNNATGNPYLCSVIVRKLFSNNSKLWSEIEQVLMNSLAEDEFNSNLADIIAPLIKLVYSLDCTIMVPVINFLSHTVDSENTNVKARSIKLALEIFTGEKSKFAIGFYKLWGKLCESMRDKSLDHELITGFVTKLLVRQPLFRSSYFHVLDYHTSFKRVRVTVGIFLAVTQAIVQDYTIFLKESYFVTFIVQGFSSKKPKIRIAALLSLAKIYRSNLFCNHTFTPLEEAQWKENNSALLNKILVPFGLGKSRVSHRFLLKPVIYMYLVPTCLPQERRVANMVQMWMSMKSLARCAIRDVAQTSSKVKDNFLMALTCGPTASVVHYVKRLAAFLGAEYKTTFELMKFFLPKRESELVKKLYLPESAEESDEVMNLVIDVAKFEERYWPDKCHTTLANLLHYVTNNLFDRDSIVILLEEILKITRRPETKVSENIIALELLEIVTIESPIITLQEEVFDKLVELYNDRCSENVDALLRIFKIISKIADGVLKMDNLNFSYYKHMVNLAKSLCTQIKEEQIKKHQILGIQEED